MGREVDRLLAQLDRKRPPSSPAKRPPPVVEAMPSSSPATIVWATTPVPPAVPLAATAAPAAATEPPDYERAALWGRILLVASLAILMTDWPYARGCGWALLAYGAAVVTVLIAGGWIALTAWKQRSAPAHILALILFYWGLVLAAEVMLPRIGYGSNAAGWHCSVNRS